MAGIKEVSFEQAKLARKAIDYIESIEDLNLQPGILLSDLGVQLSYIRPGTQLADARSTVERVADILGYMVSDLKRAHGFARQLLGEIIEAMEDGGEGEATS
jgi:hypothetical protein